MLKKRELPAVDADLETPRVAAGRAARRFPTFTITVIVALLLLVALAPTIVSMTSLGPNLVASSAASYLDGSLATKSVSVGWLSPTTLRSVEVKDKDGATIVTADSIVVSKSLLGLLTNSNDLGTVLVDKPQVLVVARPNGSNLEDLVAPLMNAPSTGAATPTVTVQVRDGLVKLVDSTTEQAWELTPVSADIASPRGDNAAWQVSAEVKLDGTSAAANIAHSLGEASATQASVELDRFSLEPLQPVLTRLLGPTRVAGTVTGKIGFELGDAGKHQKLSFDEVQGAGLAFASPAYLGEDVLQFEQVRANGTAELAAGVWQLRNLELQSDVAALVGSGDVRVSDFSSGSIPPADCDIRGVVDLARLMQMLPGTLRAKQGVQITSGQASIALASKAVAEGRRYEASLATENVQANNNGKAVSLREPIQVEAAALQTTQGWQIEKLDAHSSFLTAKATGSPQQGQLSVQGDLNRLAAELEQFIDLSDMQLAGQMNGVLQWKQATGDTYNASGNVKLAQFELAAPGVLPWKEDDLTVSFQAGGVSLASSSYGVGSGSLEVASDADRLNVQLEGGVRNISSTSPLPLRMQLTGDLATWLPRLQAFVPLAGWQVSGPINLTARGNVSPAKIDISDATVNVKQLKLHGNGVHAYEPELQGQFKFAFDSASGTTTIPTAVVQGTSIAASAEKLVMQTGKEAKITGEIAARGKLANLLAWAGDPRSVASSQMLGDAEAEAVFTHAGGITRATLKGQVTDFVYETRYIEPTPPGRPAVREAAVDSPWETAWQEPLITFGGEASYDAAKDVVSLTQMQAQAGQSAVVATGTIGQLASLCQLDLGGQVKYDLAQWTPKVQAILGQSFDMYGAHTKTFEVHGPLFDPSSSTQPGDAPLLPLALTGKASIGWDGMKWMALNVGEAEVAAELKDSTVYVQPTKIPLSEGHVQLAPVLVLRGQNWIIAHEQGKVIDNVVITPEMCSAWIKYVQPLVADATEAQGKFSVDLEKSRIPLAEPKAFDAKGTFVMHNVSIGPGPLARQLIGAAQQVKDFADGKIGLEGLAGLAGGFLSAPGTAPAEVPTGEAKQWLTFPEQSVPVEVVEGRVYHEGLTMHHKEFTIRTTGSVGINDQSINLLCEIPIRDQWLKDPKLAVLKGKSLKIPITGSITNPRLDNRAAFAELQKEIFSNVGGLLQGGLNGGLNKGSTAVQDEIAKGQTKVQDELNKGKAKIEDELRKGLNSLFK